MLVVSFGGLIHTSQMLIILSSVSSGSLVGVYPFLPHLLLAQVQFADLAVEGPVIVKNAQSIQPERHHIQQTSPPSVNSKDAEESEQHPRDRKVDRPYDKPAISLPSKESGTDQ